MISIQPMAEQTDSELIDLCKAGDKKAWEILLPRYERLIYHAALRAGASTDEAADVFQAVCLIWVEELGRLREARSLGAWLVTITRREVRARWRRDHSADGDPETLLENLPAENESPEALAGQSEDARMIQSALKDMNEPCRTLLSMLYFDPKHPSYDSIAKKLKIPANSLGPTRGRCLEKLRDIMEEFGW